MSVRFAAEPAEWAYRTELPMDFHTFTTNREACSKSGLIDSADEFYTMAFEKALERASSQFYQQLTSERTWELARKPYYNVWPSIVPMLTRLNLDLDSGLIHGAVHPAAPTAQPLASSGTTSPSRSAASC